MTDNRRNLFVQGDKFGDYTVVRLLGKGGMGAVYLMRGTSGAEYAVKIMYPDKVTHEMRRRFAYEAEFAIKIRHRNLVSVYDVGEDPETGLCYMIMDYVPGGSLSDLVKKRGRLPLEEAVPIFEQVAKALEVAHRNKLVHRDVKPDNILFDADGTPRLADLGVAKFEDAHKSAVTTTGMIIGTPAYMAPEQMLNSHDIDGRADIYALGVVLYEMLSGKRVNEGRTAIELMARALKGETLPDIRSLCPELSETMAHLVSRLCAPEPEGRPQTALEAAELLRKAASGKLVLVKKESPEVVAARKAALKERRRKWLLGAGAVVGIAALLLAEAVVLRAGRNSERPPEDASDTNVVVVATNALSALPTHSPASPLKDSAKSALYCVIDLSGGPNARYYPVSYLDAVPGIGWTDEYKTSKLVLRRIEPGEYISRPTKPKKTRCVAVMKPFYIGIFEITQKQYELVMGTNPSKYVGLLRPVGNVSWNDIRGDANVHDWPRARTVADDSFIGRIRVRTGIGDFDLPTAEQWEYACRAGTTGKYNDGGDGSLHDLVRLGRVKLNQRERGFEESDDSLARHRPDGKGGYDSYCTAVGMYKPNAWGLYDMHGNLWEWTATSCGSGRIRMLCGGCWDSLFRHCESSGWICHAPDVVDPNFGFRLSCTPGGDPAIRHGEREKTAKPQTGVTDRRVRYAKVGSHTWYYTLENGEAVIWRGHNGYNNATRPAVDPGTDEEFVVPSELDGHKVKAIGNLAFFRCRSMKSIVIPEGVREIRGWGFLFCESLKNVRIPSSLRRIGSAFNNCKSLETIDIRDCTDISGLTFGWCPSLKRVAVSRTNPAYVEIDGALYTKDRETLVFFPRTATSVSLPNFVKKIGKGAFYSSKGLASVCIPENVVEVGVSAFAYCDSLVDVRIQQGLKSVGSSVFRSCSKLKNIDFPASLERVGDSLFDHSMNLERVTFRGDAPLFNDSRQNSILGKTARSLVIAVRRGSRGWKTRDSVELPTVWPAEGFDESRPIKFVDQSVGPARTESAQPKTPDRAWSRSASGAARTAVVFSMLDRSPTAWAYSFEGGHGWEKPDFDDSKWNRVPGGFGMRDQPLALPNARINTPWTTKKLYVRRHFTWSGGDVSRAVLDLFHDDGARIYLNGYLVLEVNGYNFSWEPFEIPLEKFNNALRNGDNVFCAEICNDLGNGYFDCGLDVESGGVSVPHAGPDAVHKIKTDVGTWTVAVRDGIAQIGLGKEHVALEPRPKGHLKIPSKLGGFAIQRLAQDCFIECKELESVEIPEGVRSVGEGAFLRCSRLAEVKLPSSLEHIGPWAFGQIAVKSLDLRNVRKLNKTSIANNYQLETVKVSPENPRFYVNDGVLYDRMFRAVVFCPSSRTEYKFPNGIEMIYNYAFSDCKLKRIVIPETVEFVGRAAFVRCSALESVKFMGDDVLIHSWAFRYTPSLKTVVLPKRLKSLGESAVFAYSGLESIALPDTLEVIGDKVFENCRKLKLITLGKSLRKVGHRAFAGCRELKQIEFPVTLNEMGAEVFGGCVSLKTVIFTGNAPKLFDQDGKTLARNMYHGANPSLATLVPYGSMGWQGGSSRLPKTWPVDGGKNARAIRYFRRMDL